MKIVVVFHLLLLLWLLLLLAEKIDFINHCHIKEWLQ